MGLRTRFPSSDVGELRRLLNRVRRMAEGLHLPIDHWTLDALDPHRALDRIPELWVREGWSLRCAHRKSAEGVQCVLWAETAGTGVASVPPDLSRREDPFESVDGEPGAWSYLCSSMLRRELGEWGAAGAFRRWTKHELLLEDPRLTTVELPDDLRPEVTEDNTRVTVRFWSRRSDGASLRIYEHRDRYRATGFAHDSSQWLLGSAPLLDARDG